MKPVICFKPSGPAQRSLSTRERPPSIDLPRPEALSNAPMRLPPDAAALLQWGRDTASLPMVWDVWRRRLTCFLSTWSPPNERESEELLDAHDRRLGIVRSQATPTRALLHAVLVSLDRFCQECTGAREFKEHAIIPAALIEIWQLLLQDPDPIRPRVGCRLVDVHGRAPDAARRWAVGHHLLATLTQGQIVSLLAYERLQPPLGPAQTRQFLHRTTRLCQAGAAACRFTADLAHTARLEPSRNALDPDLAPTAPEDRRSLDHRHLVQVITRVRPLLAQARSVCPVEHAAMTEAISHFCTERHHLLTRKAGAMERVRHEAGLRLDPPAALDARMVETLPMPAVVTAPARAASASAVRRPVGSADGSLSRLLTRLAGVRPPAHP